jgi:ABC-type cobalamin/Fe3+-siderophores transport system ATPase subunit
LISAGLSFERLALTFSTEVLTPTGKVVLTVELGQQLYVLGRNGSGKSSLLHYIYAANRERAIRVVAHRQNFFEGHELSLTPQGRLNMFVHVRDQDQYPQARWTLWNANGRTQAAIYDLILAENTRARAIADAMDTGSEVRARELSAKASPLQDINELLRIAAIPIQFSLSNDVISAARRSGSSFNAGETSDGERSALLLAATALTAKPESLLIIDEPERHLHRSITAPLLRQLFAKRRDCAFIISTHDVGLPAETRSTTRIVLLRDGGPLRAFDFDFLEGDAPIPDELKRDILGARRRVLFVEGTESSLDLPLYELLFPGTSVIAKGSCHEVERAVHGIRATPGLHWVKAVGLVDGDRRPDEEVERLRTRGIVAIPVLSVESIYYSTLMQRRIALRQAQVDGIDADVTCAAAKEAALKAIALHTERLSRKAAETAVRSAFTSATPGQPQIADLKPYTVTVDIPKLVSEEQETLAAALRGGDLDAILRAYAVRETPALGAIVEALRFKSRDLYEGAVRKLLADDAEALADVKALLADVEAAFA